MNTTRTIRFENEFELTLALDGDRFLGIGDVRYGMTPLRSPELPWTVYTESEEGFRFDEFRLVDVEKADGTAVIVFTAEGTWLPRIQDADSMGDARFRSRRLKKPTATFRWSFRPVMERLGDEEWTGLAMRLSVESPGYPIHWVLEDSTWEIGGAAAGCVLVQQDVSSIDLEQRVKPDSRFSTIERFHSAQEDAAAGPGELAGGFPMDMLPRCAGASPLDFQVKDDIALCLFAEKPGLTRARLEKFADESVIHYSDRAFFALTEKASLPERKLLVRRNSGILAQHEWRNLWLDCFTEVRRRIHENYGFKLEVARPQLWVFLWSSELNAFGPAWIDDLFKALPEYKKLGYDDVFTHGVWEGPCDANGNRGNICCNYDYVYSETFGGAETMKRLFDEAHRLDIRMWQWFGMQFDAGSPLWKEHPDWLLREANGDPWDGDYQTLYCGRFRSDFGEHLLDRIKAVKDETGLDGIFWDSYQNLGVTCVDWQAPDKAPQAEEIWRMQAELQKHGYRHRCEVVTIFGVSQVGMYAFDADAGSDAHRRRSWETLVKNDEYFAWLDCSPAFLAEDAYTAAKVSPDLYFKFLGHRSVPTIDARPWHGGFLPGGDLAEGYARVNHLYHKALPHMHRLRVTEGGKYTLWHNEQNTPAIIWAFEDAETEYAGPVTDLESGETTEAEGTLPLKAGHVYRLGEQGE